MVAPAFYLWWPARGALEQRAALGSALFTGIAVGVALFAVQLIYEIRLNRIEDRQERVVRQQGLQFQLIQATDLTGIRVEDADLRGFYLRRKRLVDASFLGSDLRGAILEEAVLTRAIFNDAKIEDARFIQANLDDAFLVDVQGRDSSFASACLRRAQLIGAELRDATLVGAVLDGGDLSEATLIDADLSDASLVGANLNGADLTGAHLEGTILRRVVYDEATRWPSGFDIEERRTQVAGATRPAECVSGPE